MEIQSCVKTSFSVIGKLGSTDDGEGFIKKLWQNADSHFGEVAPLAKRDADGNVVGVWGFMSDLSGSFAPWEQNFTRGLYLAGVEVGDDAQPPESWTKWTVPAYEYLFVPYEHPGTFGEMISYLTLRDIPLAGAVHDFSCPEVGTHYLYFPIRRLSFEVQGRGES